MEVVVARIGRPHGIKGEVSVEVRTDDTATVDIQLGEAVPEKDAEPPTMH